MDLVCICKYIEIVLPRICALVQKAVVNWPDDDAFGSKHKHELLHSCLVYLLTKLPAPKKQPMPSDTHASSKKLT